jgi:hypothetical protein
MLIREYVQHELLGRLGGKEVVEPVVEALMMKILMFVLPLQMALIENGEVATDAVIDRYDHEKS